MAHNNLLTNKQKKEMIYFKFKTTSVDAWYYRQAECNSIKELYKLYAEKYTSMFFNDFLIKLSAWQDPQFPVKPIAKSEWASGILVSYETKSVANCGSSFEERLNKMIKASKEEADAKKDYAAAEGACYIVHKHMGEAPETDSIYALAETLEGKMNKAIDAAVDASESFKKMFLNAIKKADRNI